jgi:hypothetical protein
MIKLAKGTGSDHHNLCSVLLLLLLVVAFKHCCPWPHREPCEPRLLRAVGEEKRISIKQCIEEVQGQKQV